MQVFDTIRGIRTFLADLKNNQKKIGFVPTMGALHEGHLSLMRACKAENDIAVCSIYVNPAQFNDPQDLKNYPRTLEEDIAKLKGVGCDVVFAPTDLEMYPEKPVIRFSYGQLEKVMEGAHREGHFQGVGIVVSKLFNIVQPDIAYFGQKDLQQYIIIAKLVKDLSFNLNVICFPIVREDDGLAMSSRNKNLTSEERLAAPLLYKSLSMAKESLLKGEDVITVKEKVRAMIGAETKFKLDYFEVADSDDLQSVENINDHKNISLCIAAYIGRVRLIDNIYLFS